MCLLAHRSVAKAKERKQPYTLPEEGILGVKFLSTHFSFNSFRSAHSGSHIWHNRNHKYKECYE